MTEAMTAREALETIYDGAQNQDVNHKDFRIKAGEIARDTLFALSTIPQVSGDVNMGLLEALKEARKDAVIHWVHDAHEWGSTGSYADLIRLHGPPRHIANMDAAISAAEAQSPPPAKTGESWGDSVREAAKPILDEISLYEPSMGEDGGELVSVRLGDIKALRAALSRGDAALPLPTADGAPSVVTVQEYNEVYDFAEDALGGAFKDGFREGWIFAQSPEGNDYDEAAESYRRSVDIEPSEAWDGYRSDYFAKLPLAKLPTIGAPATRPASPAPAGALGVEPEQLDELKAVLRGERAARTVNAREAEYLLALLSTLAPVGAEWRPISTAPKDGTSILLWSEAWEGTWGIQMGSWRMGCWETAEGAVGEDEMAPGLDDEPPICVAPTRWQPLPSPPAHDAQTPRCLACAIPFKAGDRYYLDASGGEIHADCCGPERESYTGADGEPLGPNDPIPEPAVWTAETMEGGAS